MAIPATPSRLIVNVVSSTALDVYWSSSGANTAFYCIERGATGGPYTEIARVPVSQTAYHDLGLTAGTQYCYKVRGFDGTATYGLYVGETCATTKGVTTDHAVARFDGTTYVLQNSLAILDDAGNLTTPGTIASKPAAGGIQLDPNAATGNFILSLSPANLTGIQRVTFGNVTGTAALGAGTLTNATVNDVTVAAHTHAITGTFPASAHNLFSATHGDTTGAASPVDGDVIIGNVTPAWSKLAISIPAANVRNVLGIDNGELRPSWKTALDANNPTTIAPSDAAAPGTSLIFSHRDHQHASPATWPATAHALLSATHSDTVASGVARGDLVVGVTGPSWDNLALGGAAGSFVTRDANDVLWSTLTLPNAATTGDILYASGANAIGNLADVAAGSALVSGGVGAAPAYSASPTLTGLTLSGLTASTVIYSNAGKAITSLANAAGVLTNDGVGGLSWGAAGGAHDLLSATHTDTTASAVARGDLIVGVAGPSWDNLALGGAAGSLLTRDATDVVWSAYYMSGFAGHTYAWPDYSMSFPGADAHGYLHSDGAGTLTWDAGGAGGAHDLLSATHTDTAAQAVSRGSLVYGDSTPAWNELVIGGAAGSVLTRDANDVLWSGYYLSGTAGGTTTFAVTNAKTLTLTATDSYNLTIPATGTAVLGTGADTRIAYWTGVNTVGGDAGLTWDAATGSLHLNRNDANLPSTIILTNNSGGGRIEGIGAGGFYFTSVDGLDNWASIKSTHISSISGKFSGTSGYLNLNGIDSGKTLFLSCADTYTLTIPATGTAALLGTANVFTAGNTMSAILTVNANIQFPAVQVPDAGANVLDDYEEQTWTPALKFGGASVGMTYGTQTGTYTKIGNLVHIEVYIVLTAKGASVGSATITGCPFTAAHYPAAIVDTAAGFIGLTYTPIVTISGTTLHLFFQAATTRTALTDANFNNTANFRFGLTFRV